MDSVNNRSLFRRKSQAARDKVRQMGGVREPQGILASFQELMQVAGRDRTQNLMPRMMQQPAQFQQGGDVAMEAMRQGGTAPTLAEQLAAIQRRAMTDPDALNRSFMTPESMDTRADIAAAPTPRQRLEMPDIATMVRQDLGDNEEAQANFSNIVDAISDPEARPEQVQEAVTNAVGVENTTDNFRSVVSRITGREQPASATVDELNRAITGVALGGAIGGPRSAAARISEALLTGLQAERETAMGRELLESKIALAELERSRKNPLEVLYGDSVKELETEFFGDIPQYLPTLQGTLSGLPPIIAGDKDRILSIYSTAMDDSDNLLALTAESMALLDTGEVTGFEGAASRLATRAAAALPDGLAASLGIDPENQQVSAAQQFDVIQRVLAAQLAPMLLGESGRTISDADRQRVAQILGVAIDEKGGLDTRNLAKSAFKSEAETRAAISEVQSILQRNRAAVESEFEMLTARIPGLQVQRPETSAPAAAPAAAPPPAIVLTEEDITRLGG
jgi:hypothetical protein